MSDEKYLYGQPVGLNETQERIMKTRLRDNLAAAALTGMLASPHRFGVGDRSERLADCKTDFCELAYSFADKMLEVRDAPNLPPLPEARETPAQAPEAPAASKEAPPDAQHLQGTRP